MTLTAGSSPAAAESSSVADRGGKVSRFGPGFDPASLVTADACQEAVEEITREIVTIEGQLEAEEHPDPIWLVRARTALKHRRATRQAVQYRLGKLRRAERREEHIAVKVFERDRRTAEFVRVCLERLPQATFEMLWDEVDRRLAPEAAP